MLQYPMNTLKLKKALKTTIFTHEEIANILKNEVFNLYLNSSKKQYFLKSKTTNIFLI
jgi:hypothetical protein